MTLSPQLQERYVNLHVHVCRVLRVGPTHTHVLIHSFTGNPGAAVVSVPGDAEHAWLYCPAYHPHYLCPARIVVLAPEDRGASTTTFTFRVTCKIPHAFLSTIPMYICAFLSFSLFSLDVSLSFFLLFSSPLSSMYSFFLTRSHPRIHTHTHTHTLTHSLTHYHTHIHTHTLTHTHTHAHTHSLTHTLTLTLSL